MSTGYGASFSIGAAALPFAANVLGGLRLLAAGRDPMEALNGVGLVCFILAFGLVFLLRLVLWERSSPRVRDATRAFLTGALVVIALASILTIVLALRTPQAPGWLVAFAVLAVLCGGAGLIWVFRYRREI